MEGTRATRRALAPLVLAAALAASGCGADKRQSAQERAGTYRVEIVDASFPLRQRLARAERLVIAVRNAGSQTLPNVAVTVDSFARRSERRDLDDARRPVWIVDSGPAGADTAYTSTWALGRLAAGQTRRFVWRVTAIEPGTHRVRYRVAAGLSGRAMAVLTGNEAPAGEFTVDVASRPAQARVDPESGLAVRDGE